MAKKLPKLLVINGSIKGNSGNCGEVCKFIKDSYQNDFDLAFCHLNKSTKKETLLKLNKAEAFVFITGTYWESWGSPLQKFLEDFSDLEAFKTFIGKPTGCMVLCHSTGGKSVLSRLQANLNLFGCLIPPFAGMELSMVTQMALDSNSDSAHKDDLWSLKDCDLIFQNIKECIGKQNFKPWKTDNLNFRKKWIKT